MSEWLDLMLEEITRKEREAREAQKELERRAEDLAKDDKSAQQDTQSK